MCDERLEIWAQLRTFSAAGREVFEHAERAPKRRPKSRVAFRVSLGVPRRGASKVVFRKLPDP